VVKYFVKPVESDQSQNSVLNSADLLRDAMQQRLANEQPAARFEFGIEVQTDPETMLIEDATQEWNSPEQVVLATITIPPQDFLSDTRTEFGEALSFSPWRSLPEHQPLGSINRARRDAYFDSSITRHKTTGATRQEPDLCHFNSLTLTRFFECFSKGDYQGMQSCLHPDVEFTDIGFELRGKEVGAMWHMIVLKGIQVSFRDIKVDDGTGTAHWECDYQFRKDADSEPRPVHNVVDAKFCFEGGLVREHHDECDFWNWFEQAMGPIGKGAHLFDFLEDKIEQLLKRALPFDVEQKLRAKVKETARQKITAFIKQNRKYAG
jgi:SnoaL-like domain